MPPSPPPPHAAWLRRPLAQGLLLLAVTAAAYAGAARAGFVFDDHGLVEGFRPPAGLTAWWRCFAEDLWAGVDQGISSGYYRPLMGLSLLADRALFGTAPAGPHLHSLAWHLLAVLALHRLLLRLVRPVPALVGAALFALHPAQSEVVLWISARNDAMAAALLLTALALLEAPTPSPARLTGGALAALGAVMAKESALLAPLFLLALDLARHGRPCGWPRHAALWGAVGAHLALRALAGVNPAAAPSPLGWSVLGARAPDVLATAGGLLCWPWPLSVGRDLESLDLAPLPLGLGLAACVLLPLALLWPRTNRRTALAGLVWAILGTAPAVLALADKALFGERYLYVGLAGLALALASAVEGWEARSPGRPGLLLLLALPWCLLIRERAPAWRDDLSLWEAALRDTPSGYVQASLGATLQKAGRSTEALGLFQAALAAMPPRLEVCPVLANLAQEPGDLALAAAVVDDAAARGCADPTFAGHRAVLLALTGRWAEAEALAAAHLDDRHGRTRLVLAAAGLVRGDCARYRAELANATRPEDMDAQIARILTFGGHPVAAESLLAGALCASGGPP